MAAGSRAPAAPSLMVEAEASTLSLSPELTWTSVAPSRLCAHSGVKGRSSRESSCNLGCTDAPQCQCQWWSFQLTLPGALIVMKH